MIRKILLVIFLIFTIAWFAIAYTLKSNIVTLIKNSESDNVKILYDNIKVSGYPTKWEINIIAPRVKIIDHVNSQEISSKKLAILLNLSFKKATLSLGQELRQSENSGDKIVEYIIHSDENIKALMKFNKPLYRISNNDNVKSIAKSLQLNNKLLSIINQDKEVFNLADLAFMINKAATQQDENIALNLHVAYNAQNNFLNFKKAELELVTNVHYTTNDNEKNPNKDFAIDRLVFSCDDDSKVDLTGSLQLFKSKLPHGKLSFVLNNYHNIIDKLVPDNSFMSKKMITTIIEKSINSSLTDNDTAATTYENVKFDIEFSDKGINIGSINLLEFKVENNKVDDASE